MNIIYDILVQTQGIGPTKKNLFKATVNKKD